MSDAIYFENQSGNLCNGYSRGWKKILVSTNENRSSKRDKKSQTFIIDNMCYLLFLGNSYHFSNFGKNIFV